MTAALQGAGKPADARGRVAERRRGQERSGSGGRRGRNRQSGSLGSRARRGGSDGHQGWHRRPQRCRVSSGTRNDGDQVANQPRIRSRWDRPPDAVTRGREDGTEPGTTLTESNAVRRSGLPGRWGGTSGPATARQAARCRRAKGCNAARRRTRRAMDRRGAEPGTDASADGAGRRCETRLGAERIAAGRITWSRNPPPTPDRRGAERDGGDTGSVTRGGERRRGAQRRSSERRTRGAGGEQGERTPWA